MREGDKVYYEGKAYIYDGCAKGLSILKEVSGKNIIMVDEDEIATVDMYNTFLNCLKVGLNNGDININIGEPKATTYNNGCAKKYVCELNIKIKGSTTLKTEIETWNNRL